MNKEKQRKLWTLLAAIAATMWGVSGICAKELFNISPEITPIWLTQIRLIISGIILLIAAGVLKRHPIKALKNKRDAGVMLAYGLFGLLPVQLFYFLCIQEANASIATILQFIGPFFVMGYLAITKQQVLRRLDVFAAIMAFLGVFLLSTHGRLDQLAITLSALIWGLLSAVGEASYTLIPVNHPQMPHIPNKPEVWLWTAAVIVIGTIIPFQLMANALRYVKPATVSLLDAFEPLSATIGSVLCFGLVMMPMDWVGTGLVIVAVLALNIVPKKINIKFMNK